jgi:hypothetical protein
MTANAHRLLSFGDLLPNWDSSGSLPLSRAGLAWLASVLAEVEPHCGRTIYVFPTARGGVQIEWEDNGIGSEAYVDLSNGIAEVYTGDDPVRIDLRSNRGPETLAAMIRGQT